MHRADEIGAVESGRLADLVTLDAGPMTDVLAMKSVHLVSKVGQHIYSDRKRTKETESPERAYLTCCAEHLLAAHGYYLCDNSSVFAPFSKDPLWARELLQPADHRTRFA